MFCKYCGAQLSDSAMFCGNCGASLAPAPNAPTPLTDPQPLQFATPPVLDAPVPATEKVMPAAEAMNPPVQAPFYAPVPPYGHPQPPVYAPKPEPTDSPAPQNAPKKEHTFLRRPPLAVRILLKVFSVLLCIMLVVSILVNAALLDLRHLTSVNGLEAAISGVLGTTESSEEAAERSEENLEMVVDMVYDIAQEQENLNIPFSREELQDFVEKSTVPEYLTQKLAGYASDIINGTQETEIHADELMDLLEENERALRTELGITLTREDKEEIAKVLQTEIEENDLNETIHQTVNETLEENLGMDLEVLRDDIRWITDDSLLWGSLGISLLLILLLLGLNYYNPAAGLTCIASAGVAAGLILMVPLLLVQAITDALISSAPEMAGLDAVVQSVLPGISSIHTWLLVGSIIVLLISIGLRVTFWILRRRRANAAAA